MNPEEHERLQQLFEQENVTAVIVGHDHLYNRLTVNGVVNIISGGAGAPPYLTPWGGNYYHYLRVEANPNQVNFTTIGLDGLPVDEYQLPYNGPIEIEIRGFANATTQRADTVPAIYFSEVPVEKNYSWDNNANTSSITGFPGTETFHTLDVYAENQDGMVSHKRFVFFSVVSTTTSTTTSDIPTENTTSTGSTEIPTTLILIAAGIGGLVIVVLVIIKKR
jgi:hypothetical protein